MSFLQKAREAGRARGVRFVGDDREGRFEGVAQGGYLVTGDEVRITVIHELAHHLGIDDDRLHDLGVG